MALSMKAPDIKMVVSPKQYVWPTQKHSLNRFRDLRHYRNYRNAYVKDVVADEVRDIDKSTGTTSMIIERLVLRGVVSYGVQNFNELLKEIGAPSKIKDLRTFFEYYS